MRNMGRSGDVEAFARLLDGAPAGDIPASMASLGRTVSALSAIPAPTLPASLKATGGVAFMAAAGTRIASTNTASTNTASTNTASTASTHAAALASPASGSALAKVAAAKAGLLGIFSGHLAPVMAGTALLAVGVTGVAVGASRSLPGDPLYGLKRASESVHTATVSGRVNLAERHLDLATTRLHEAIGLQQRGGSPAQLTTELKQWTSNESAALRVLGPLASAPAVRARLAAFSVANAAGLSAFPAAVVAPQVAAVSSVTALLTPGQAPSRTVRPAIGPRAPSAGIASPAPQHFRPVTPSEPSTVTSLPASHATAPGAATPPVVRHRAAAPTSTAPAARAPGVAPSLALPTVDLPATALPTTALPTVLPSAPDVTTLLQNLIPQH